MKGLAIALIIIGILMMIFQGFSFTQEKKVADLGPVEINKQEEKNVNWPLYAGGIVTVAGIVVLITASKKRA